MTIKTNIYKLLKYISIALISVIGFVYITLVSYLWWSEYTLEPIKTNLSTVYKRTTIPHKLTLLNDGHGSLLKRIKLIENAKESIELEFFIYELDMASKLISNKLIEASKRGVKVKLMVDFSAPVFKLRPVYANYLKKNGIEVKYYNTVSNSQYIEVQHRSHRKFLIVDSKFVITGGRNIGDDYFNLSKTYNFLDSDILLEGPVVKHIRKSYYEYWDSNLASTPLDESESTETVNLFFGDREEERLLLKKLYDKQEEIEKLDYTAICNDLTFITDYPGVSLENRQVYRRLASFLSEAQLSIDVESPYFVLKTDGLKLLKDLAQKGIKQQYLTNGLYSTDAYYTVSAMVTSLPALKDKNISVSMYNGNKPSNTINLGNEITSNRWGLHSKRAVVDDKHIIVGTYNIDPRSANLNSEVLIICRDNPELASYMKNDMLSRRLNSMPLLTGEETHYRKILKKASKMQTLLFILSIPLSKAFDFLL
jgi:cardiolipin synthase C